MDLADHPGLLHLPEFLQMDFVEQVEEGGAGEPALEIQAKGMIQSLSVPFGKRLESRELLQPLRIPSTATNSRR